MSEYAVNGNDAGKGSFLAALAEAGFLVGLERNRYTCPPTKILCFYCLQFCTLLHFFRHFFCDETVEVCDMIHYIYLQQPRGSVQQILFMLTDNLLVLICSDTVEMASYAPLFVNDNDRRYALFCKT